MILVFVGPPGSGKGTQAKKLSAKASIPQLSTGDMLRAAIAAKTQVGLKAKSFIDAGELVPDQVVIDLIAERIQQPDCTAGFILDGFPRTIPQAEALDELLKSHSKKIHKTIEFSIPDGELVRRLSGRRTCTVCGSMFHVEFGPKPTSDGCGEFPSCTVVQRSDDQPDVIKKRLDVYHQQTQPLVKFYQGTGRLSSLDAALSPEQVETQVKSLIGLSPEEVR